MITIIPSPEKNRKTILDTSERNFMKKEFFDVQKKVRVAWVPDDIKIGGAELSNITLVNYGVLHGYDICAITPNKFDVGLLYASDVAIINNIFSFSKEQLKTIFSILIDNSIPYVKYDHDIRCSKRGDFARCMFTRSALNVFISPFHRSFYEKAFGDDVINHSITLPVAIDDSKFKITNTNRKPNSVLVTYLPKQQNNIMKFIMSNYNYSYMALGHNRIPGLEIAKMPKVENESMCDIYNQFEYVLNQPDSPSAGDRVYFEATLCGCKVITNENVGHVSWGWDINNYEFIREQLKKAIVDFWDNIRRIL